MATEVKRRRGTTSEHSTFTGALGEVTVDTTKDTLVVHDNSQVGGFPLLREDFSNVPNTITFYEANADTINFNTSYSDTGDEPQGGLYWNTDEKTLSLVTNGSTLEIGHKVELNVINDDPNQETIDKGSVVSAYGSPGASGKISVKLFQAGTDPTRTIVGILDEDIAYGFEGKAIAFGKIRKLDTANAEGGTWNAGDILYASSTAGALTKTAPSAGNVKLPIAYVVTDHPNVGEIFVRITPIDENAYQTYDADLSTIAGLAKTDGNFIVGNGSAWVAESGATARTSLGLGNVENVALSTYTGQGGSLDNQYILNGAGYITGYTETDTLSDVTGRGASTTDTVTLDKSSASTGYALIVSGSAQQSIRFLHTGTTIESTGTFNIDAGASDTENINLNAGHIYLNNNADVDGNLGVTGNVTASNLAIANWNTAYGWGDHASAGYLTSETSHADVVVDGDFTANGLMKRTGAGTYTTITDSSTNWDAAYTYSQVGHLPLSGGTISSDLTISGNLTVSGTTTTVNSTSVTVADNNLTLNAGEVGAGVTEGTSGIIVDRGTEADFAFLFVESDDKFKIGTSGNLQTVATRQDDGTATDGGIMYFNNTNKRLDNSSNATLDASGNLTLAGTISASEYNNSNWDTAFGWGNHASAGYLTSFDITTQTDPKYLRSDADDTTTGQLTVKNLLTSASNTQYSLFSRDSSSADNAALYVQSANSTTNKRIARFAYGSTSAGAGNPVLEIRKDTTYFTNTNVGIGTSSPSADLDVNGDILAENLTIDGSYTNIGGNASWRKSGSSYTLSWIDDKTVKFVKSASAYAATTPYGEHQNFIATFSFKTTNATHLGLVYHGQNSPSEDGYNVIIRNLNTVRVQKRQTNVGQSYLVGGGDGIAISGVDIDDGNWHRVTVQVIGQKVRVDIDGNQIINSSYSDTTFTEGGVGYISYDGTVEFNNLEVQEIPSTTFVDTLNLDGISEGASDTTALMWDLGRNVTYRTLGSNAFNSTAFLTTETDPVFSASAASGITSTDIANWDSSYQNSLTGASFNTSTGIVTVSAVGGAYNTVSLDGRYYTESEVDTLLGGKDNYGSWSLIDGSATSANINSGNSVTIQGGVGITTSLDAETKVLTITNSSTADITGVTAGAGLTGGGTSGTVTLSHADTSSQGSVNNSNGTVIQDVTLDTYGHVTGLVSYNLDGRYYTETEIDTILNDYLTSIPSQYLTETEGDARYLQLTGGSLTGVLDFNNVSGRAITITADTYLDGRDASIYLGNATSNYGWDLEYQGSGSGNNNKLRFVSTNNGAPKVAFEATQDGVVNLAQSGATVNGNTILTEADYDTYVCHLKTDQNTSLAEGSANEFTVNFNIEEHNDTSYFSHNNGVVTVLEAGWYRIYANMVYDNATDSARNTIRAYVKKNGTEIVSTRTYDYDRGSVYGKFSNNKIETMLYLSVNDTVEIANYAYNEDGSVTIEAAESEFIVNSVAVSANATNADTLDGEHGSYYRNASNINAGTISDARLPSTITSSITGNASTATKLATSREIILGGDLTGSAFFDGSSDITISAQVSNNSHTHDDRYYTETEIGNFFSGSTAITGYNKANWDSSYQNSLSGVSFNTGTGVLTVSAIGGAYTADLDGRYLTSYTETDPVFSASAASGITSTNINNWNLAYNNHITAVGFNTSTGVLTLTQNDTGTITVDLDGRYLTTETGDIQGVTAGNGLSGGGTSGTVTLAVDFGELPSNPAVTIDATDQLIWYETGSGTENRTNISSFPLSKFNNDSGWTSNVGDITGVTAGTGLSGGGTSGTVTLSHADTSTVTSVDNSGGTVIQDITVDTYGHVTAIGSYNLDARYYTETESDGRYLRSNASDTTTGNITISKTDPTLTLVDTNTATGNYPRINFDTNNNQGVSLYHNEFDSELSVAGYGLVLDASPSNTQFPTTGTLSFSVLGEIYAGGTTLGSLNKVFHDGYHPNADTLTASRTISLSNNASGSVSFNGSSDVSISTSLVPITIDSNDNANSLSDGIYGFTNDAPSNIPDDYGMLFQFTENQSQQLLQTYGGSPNQVSLYGRRKTGGTWDTVWTQYFSDHYHPNADKLTTPRSISLTGAVTGSTTFDGSGNVSISTTATSDPTLTLSGDATGSATFTNLGNATLSVTVVDDSHNHIIGNVDGLQTALDGKLSLSGGTLSGALTVNSNINISGNLDVGSQVGTWIESNVMTDSIGWNTSYGVYIGSNVGGTHYLRGNGTFTTGGSTYNLWHAGNDGSGSGLDADLLDGQHGSYYTNAGNLTGTIPDVFSNGTRYNIGLIDGSSSQTRDKIRVWNGSLYTIGMKDGYSYGHLGGAGTDYAMSFQMNNDAQRGFWWGDDNHSDAQGAMSLTTQGKLTVATSISVGEGESIIAPSSQALYVNGESSFNGVVNLLSVANDTNTTSALFINQGQDIVYRTLGSNAFNSTTIPTNNNQLINGAGYLTSFDITTQTDPKYLRSNSPDSWNIGRGDVYVENNSSSNANGAGITFRTSNNPSSNGASIFDVRSSGQAVRLFVGQNLTSSGYNAFYAASSNSTDAGSLSSYNHKLGTSSENTYLSVNGGNVGIGESTPDFALQVATPEETTDPISFAFDITRENSGTRGMTFGMATNDTFGAIGTHNADLQLGHTFGTESNGQPAFYPTLTIQHIDQSVGNVGIGTTSPVTELDVNGTTTTNKLVADNTATIGFSNLGNASILAGTTSLGIGIDSNEIRANGGSLYIGTIGANNIDFGTGGTNGQVVIKSGGNVGIGTTSPDKKLHLSDASRVDILFEKVGSEKHFIRKDGDYLRFRGHNDSTVLFELKNNTNGSNACSFPSGNVGIGTTSPNAQLQIDTPADNQAGQGLRLNRPSAGTNYHSVEFATNGTVDWSVGQNSNDAFEVYENGAAVTTRFTIKEGGNVGIGDTTPSDTLVLRRASSGQTEHGLRLEYVDDVGPTTTNSAVLVGDYGLKFKNYNSSRNFLFETGNVDIEGNIRHTGDTNTYFGFHNNDQWRVVTGGSERIEVTNTETVINDGSNDYNFRVESNNNANMLKVDGGNDAVGIGINPSSGIGLHVYHATADAPLKVQSGDAYTGISFQDTSTTNHLFYKGSENHFYFNGSGVTLGVGVSSVTTTNLSLDVENKVRASGIMFGTDTADANTLDDYEEGTFTPIYRHTGGTPSSVTYDSQTYGVYTRIGNVVHCSGRIRTDAITWASSSYNTTLGGFPFTCVTPLSTGTGAIAGNIGFASGFAGTKPVTFQMRDGETNALLYGESITSSEVRGQPNIQSGDFTTGTSADKNTIVFQITYHVA